MTTEEFKLEYPQHSHLEGDDLWDKMTELILQQDNVLYADPTPQGKHINEYYLKHNKIALENALIELNYMV